MDIHKPKTKFHGPPPWVPLWTLFVDHFMDLVHELPLWTIPNFQVNHFKTQSRLQCAFSSNLTFQIVSKDKEHKPRITNCWRHTLTEPEPSFIILNWMLLTEDVLKCIRKQLSTRGCSLLLIKNICFWNLGGPWRWSMDQIHRGGPQFVDVINT